MKFYVVKSSQNVLRYLTTELHESEIRDNKSKIIKLMDNRLLCAKVKSNAF